MADSMRQSGRVVAVNGKKASVRIVRSSACGHCNACFSLGKNEADIEMDNLLDAEVGDTVSIELHAGSVFKASFIVYGIPLVALIAGAAIGSLKSDLFAALGGVLFAAGSFFILRALEPRFARMSEFKPRMIEIVDIPDETDKGGNAC